LAIDIINVLVLHYADDVTQIKILYFAI